MVNRRGLLRIDRFPGAGEILQAFQVDGRSAHRQIVIPEGATTSTRDELLKILLGRNGKVALLNSGL